MPRRNNRGRPRPHRQTRPVVTPQRTDAETLEQYARDLVSRDLASDSIIEPWPEPRVRDGGQGT